MIREPKLKLKLFVEGDTEENYFVKLRKNNNIELVYKEVNLGGGGYTSFLKEIKKHASELGYIAVFIVIDMDRLVDDQANQKQSFEELIQYCRSKNKNGRIPYFLIATNRDFEFFACSHCPNFKDSNTTQYITKKFGYPSLDEFKSDEKVYEFLNKDSRSFDVAIKRIKSRITYISNVYKKETKNINVTIKISKININPEALNYSHSNLYEFFDIIGAI